MDSHAQRIRRGLLKIQGVIESPGIFAEDDAFWVNGREIAHFHGDDAVELRLTRQAISAQRKRLKEEPRVELRAASSDWISVRFSSARDVTLVLELAEIAANAHRPPPGVAAKPPPTGAALERRRRFH